MYLKEKEQDELVYYRTKMAIWAIVGMICQELKDGHGTASLLTAQESLTPHLYFLFTFHISHYYADSFSCHSDESRV